MSEPATSSSSDSSKFNGECGKVRIFIRSPTTTLPDDFSILTSLDSSVLTLKRAIFETHPTKPNVRDQRLIYRGRPSFQTSAETTSTTNARIATPLTEHTHTYLQQQYSINPQQQQDVLVNQNFYPFWQYYYVMINGMPYIVPIHYPYRYMYPYPYVPTPQIGVQAQQPLIAQIPEPQQDAAARNQRRAATLWLIVKLGFLVYIFSQNASTERMILLYFMAFVIFLHQTGRLRIVRRRRQRIIAPIPNVGNDILAQQLPQMPVQQNPGGLPIPQPDLNNRNTPSSSSSTAHLPPSPMPNNDPSNNVANSSASSSTREQNNVNNNNNGANNVPQLPPDNARSITLQDVEHALWTFVASLIPTNAPDVGQQDDVAM
ncbi:homocysteine-responsive endoplasmic reticulum-resident ubiquitin-like domain member 2 protein [Gigaspora margarita]|uniref:Homocysteine-responsive endoplasmic reticulum-resident ubiquitin-like domain member 2 protein n=1 Tax=Gigaspora margarita TaxID=4874 RepID=A0A8H3XDR4_GIGMA|nr:homocysteine-responsive endoplasmic reticulum-resident ubiquitin-like domain member 2 protein [Gigaspora margarita]